MLLLSSLSSHVTQIPWFLFPRDREGNYRTEEKVQTITCCSFQANAGRRLKWWEKDFISAQRIIISELTAEMGEFLTPWAEVRGPDTAFRRYWFFEALCSPQLPFTLEGQHPPVPGRGVARSFLLTSPYQIPGEGMAQKACKRCKCKFNY